MKINTSSDHFLIKKSDFKDLFNIMKICLFLLFAFAFQLMATNTNAQDAIIELRSNSVTVSQLISEIEKQTDYLVVYSNREVNTSRTVSLKNKSDKVSEYLNQTFSGTDIGYDFEKNYIVLSKKTQQTANTITNLAQALQQQGKTVRGTVTDSNGEPVIGATIVVKDNPTQGTVTDIDGNYILNNVLSNATLVFSFVGMSDQEINVGNRSTIDVLLTEDTIDLDEIIAVGYATQRAGFITGSVSSIKEKDLKALRDVTSSAQLLKGNASGVTVASSHILGGGAVVRVRGLGTINNNDPIWIVDGVPGGAVDPNNIESISILKDASAQAIYGAKAANGIILVTTKSGKMNTKAQVSIDIKRGVGYATRKYDMLNTKEYGEMLWLSAKNSNIQNYSHALYGSGPTPVIPEYIIPAQGVNVDESLYDNKMIHEDGTDTYLITKANKIGTDWMDEILQSADFQEYNMDLNGGSDNTTYSFQLGYLGEQGLLIHTNFKKYNARSNIQSQVTPWLKLGSNFGVIYRDLMGNREDHSEGSGISWAYRMQPIIPVYDIAGNHAGTVASNTGNGRNPVFFMWKDRYDNYKNFNVTGNFNANIKFTKDLSFTSLLGVNYTANNDRDLNFIEKAFSERSSAEHNLSESANFSMQYNWSNTLAYSSVFNDLHKVNLLLGSEIIDSKYEWRNASRETFFSEDPYYMQLNVGQLNINNGGSMSEWALFSLFGRLNYEYSNKYLFEGVVRRDGSSRFGKGHQYATFPAVSLGWRISEEPFMDFSNDWLNTMKIKAGWGQIGNDQIGNYTQYATYASMQGGSAGGSYYPITGVIQGPGTAGFYRADFGNPNVKWEITTTTNVGFDATAFNNFTFGFELWKRLTNNMLFPKAIPMVYGQGNIPSVNIGSMENKGFDFDLGYNGSALNNELTYGVNLNLSHYKNKLTKLSDDENETLEGNFLRNMQYTKAAVGSQFPEFYGYIVDGIFQTDAEAASHPAAFGTNYNKPGHFKYRDINNDNVIDSKDRTFIGDPHPDFTAGLRFNINYKGFDLSTRFYCSYGNELINYTRRWMEFALFEGGKSHDRLYNSWGSPYLADNKNAKLPITEFSDTNSQNPSSFFVEDASYLRMENLRIGYDLSRILKKFAMNDIRIYGDVTNLFTLTKYSGLDPEVSTTGMNMGVDFGGWPTQRRFTIGVNLVF